MQNLVVASADEAWSYGGSIMTFLLPMIAFVLVAGTLLVIYTKPELVPGRRADEGEAPVGATRFPGKPTAGPGGQGAGGQDVTRPSSGNGKAGASASGK